MEEITLALRDNPEAQLAGAIFGRVAFPLLIAVLVAWRQKRPVVRGLIALIGLAVAANAYIHSDIQTSVILSQDKITVTNLRSPGWSVPAQDIAEVKVRWMRTTDEIVLETRQGDIKQIKADGDELRKTITEAIGRYYGMKQSPSVPTHWTRP